MCAIRRKLSVNKLNVTFLKNTLVFASWFIKYFAEFNVRIVIIKY